MPNSSKRSKNLNLAAQRKRPPSPSSSPPKRTTIFVLGEIVHRFERSAAVRLLIILSIPAALLSLSLQYTEVLENNLGRSWANLTAKSSGNSGKISALEHLSKEVGNLPNLDLSCLAMGGMDETATGERECARPTYLSGIDLYEEGIWNVHTASLIGANLNGVDLSFSDLKHAGLLDISAKGSNLMRASLEHSFVEKADFTDAAMVNANLSYANASGADFTNANLHTAIFYAAYMPQARFINANLSHTYFYASYLDGADFTGSWAWADQPPIGIKDIALCAFDPTVDNRWTKPAECTPAPASVRALPPISLTGPLEERECGAFEAAKLFVKGLINRHSSVECWRINTGYSRVWLDGKINSKQPTKRFDQLINGDFEG